MPRRFVPFVISLPLIAVGSPALCQSELELLREEFQRLSERLEQLERHQSTEPSPKGAEQHSGDQRDSGTALSMDPEVERLSSASPGAERGFSPSGAEVEPKVEIGGALRFNYVYRDFVEASDQRYGESGLDISRLNINGEIDSIIIAAEYRFYSYMHTLRYGWIGYEFSDESQIQLGVHQVPFGLLPYAAHNSWFGVPYYIGLADDYDMGVKYVRQDGPWSSALAFYKNEEFNDASDLGRYGFDLVRDGDEQAEEVNRLNARLAYTFGLASGCETELGGSAQRADIYDVSRNRNGDHWAAALHLDNRCGRWNLQLQAARYRYDMPGSDNVRVGAFETSYLIANEADVLVANLAYNFNSSWAAVDQIICYNDYSQLLKKGDSHDSRINTVGCGIGSGPLFTYVDYILANNMAFFGDGSMAGGGRDEWHSRFNINIGFYW